MINNRFRFTDNDDTAMARDGRHIADGRLAKDTQPRAAFLVINHNVRVIPDKVTLGRLPP